MSSLNRVTLIGNVGREPEIKNTQAGKHIANLSIATSERWRDKQTGERREKTEWHRVVVFNEALADIVQKYVRKGSKLYVEGSLKTRKWTDQGGAERYTTEVVLQSFDGKIVLLDRPQGGAQGGEGEGDEKPAQAERTPQRHDPAFDDDIPF